MNRKLQIFISSTHDDLIEERNAAIEAILDAGHIPAGMEQFKPGKSQMETICKWIDESDIYVIILGGRYGSIEPKSGKSYTHLEYEYAIFKKKPCFAIILNEAFLTSKINTCGFAKIMEQDAMDKYQTFKSTLMSVLVKLVSDCKDIKNVIYSTINEYANDDSITGWIRNNKKIFQSSEELDVYIAERISMAKKSIYDLTWKDYTSISRPDFHTYLKLQQVFCENAMSILNKEICYKEIFTFPCHKKERIGKMRELIKYNNYWCGFFESEQSVGYFPKLHVTIIDEEEAIFASYNYNGNLCSIYDANIVKILISYFEECWILCKKIKDNDGVHQDILDKIIAEFDKEKL